MFTSFFSGSRTTDYSDLVQRVAALASNSEAQNKLKTRNLRAMTVAWEDTSRFKNSCVGSNISDLTLKVGSSRLPIIRGENFTDTTVDLTLDKLPMLVVGNESGSALTKVTLKEYLENLHKYCGEPTAEPMNLFNRRDDFVLGSAQACVLPTDNGKVEFAVDLYNYQSSVDEPAVLVIMATAYGTSCQVVSGGNTVLYFNGNGTSRLFKAERLTDYRTSKGVSTSGSMTSEEKALNGIYIFQVPLKIKERPRRFYDYDQECCLLECASVPKSMFSMANTRGGSRGMERAVLSVGEEKGPYKGIKKSSGGLYKLERDTEKPIRLTVQFYMCSDTDNISDENVEDIASQIRQIYDKGLNEGSLVVDHSVSKPGLPDTNSHPRPTASTSYTSAYLDNNIL
ncbi:hypothetical protein QJ856_gp1146 [Tupanvirus deep ocean]|uniref:Uncharacterized protein n=2 Tax=Tupanvirus TaxID=2094720 RepID=A0AC62A7I0_9VIRU|nr:hypothetical protein QJ856_gp1146 [Tupanvirus deep ocean]QKU33612.1 hypothetical protein [Tupanvirus deep ocean]